jgi:peptidyl-prolyl cis-trans isomerase C
MKRRVTVLMIAGLIALGGAGAASQESPGGGETVATVGESRITKEDLRDELLEERKSGDTVRVLESLTPEGRQRILRNMIERRLFAAEARKRRMNEDPEIQRAIFRAVNEVLADFLVKSEMQRLDLSDPALLEYYKANEGAFTTGGRVKARHIVVATEEEAKEALREVQGGKDFAKVASERNIDASRKTGGELGWVPRGVMVKPFDEALFSLSAGEVSPIVKTNFGFHIIKVEEIEAPKVRPFDVVKTEIRKRMVDDHIRKLEQEIEKQVPVHINEEVLKAWHE